MSTLFSDNLKKLRVERGLSQREVADRVSVTRSAVARWENGSRIPDAVMLARLSRCLQVDADTLLTGSADYGVPLRVIMVDDRKIVLTGGLPVLKEVMPDAEITGFTRPSEAIEYAQENRVALAFLDIELGKVNGLDLCRKLLEIWPRTNVVFLTAYSGYSLDAWSTGACGFMLKPITAEAVRAQIKNLRYPFPAGRQG